MTIHRFNQTVRVTYYNKNQKMIALNGHGNNIKKSFLNNFDDLFTINCIETEFIYFF